MPFLVLLSKIKRLYISQTLSYSRLNGIQFSVPFNVVAFFENGTYFSKNILKYSKIENFRIIHKNYDWESVAQNYSKIDLYNIYHSINVPETEENKHYYHSHLCNSLALLRPNFFSRMSLFSTIIYLVCNVRLISTTSITLQTCQRQKRTNTINIIIILTLKPKSGLSIIYDFLGCRSFRQ